MGNHKEKIALLAVSALALAIAIYIFIGNGEKTPADIQNETEEANNAYRANVKDHLARLKKIDPK